MRLTGSTHVVLRAAVRAASGAVVLPRGARGVVVRNTGAAVIVRFESGQVVSVRSERLEALPSR